MITAVEQTLTFRFNQAKAMFEADWKDGTYAWLQQNAVGHMVTITLAEGELDAAWIAARADTSQGERFYAALGRWKDAHVAALNEFNTRSGQ